MAKRKSKTEKFLDAQIDAFYKAHAEGKAIDIFDIAKVWKMARDAAPQGLAAVEAAVIAGVAKFCHDDLDALMTLTIV